MKTRTGIISIVAIICWSYSFPVLKAQTDTVPALTTSIGVDLVSRYVWRGLELGSGPSIQPGFSASYKGFTIGTWGAYNLTGTGEQETDFFVSKTVGFLTVSVWDYWMNDHVSAVDFFNYRDKTTNHLLEAQVMVSGGEKLPFNFLASYIFYGADPSRSMYFELQYLPDLSLFDLMVFAGYQPKGEFYASDPGFVSMGCTVKKPVNITDRFSIPLSLSLILNPVGRSAWLVAGITF